MAHKYAIESLDRTLKDVMSANKNSKDVFGGKVVVFGGDFRHILPVVPRGSHSDIVHCAINASYIWHSVEGQSLDNVGLYIPRDVFTHGQIYVALSRVTTKKGIKILTHDEEKKFKGKTTNVVYKEVFNNV
ncbi:uncharacterized protein LOC131649504 [Vicia villosa]|uniref:uncharacterized protein LOC131649504 n=1 Tax=Vicia villosa TaxID=3911 RepID=UPI00273AD4AC|nr:uncharacterized protein LOC131649504 [Vicia villosa]